MYLLKISIDRLKVMTIHSKGSGEVGISGMFNGYIISIVNSWFQMRPNKLPQHRSCAENLSSVVLLFSLY